MTTTPTTPPTGTPGSTPAPPPAGSSAIPQSALVVGAGIVGLATALHLQRRGVAVTVIDRKGPAGGASFGNGGILTPQGFLPVSGPGLMRSVPKMWLDRKGPLFIRKRDMPAMAGFFARYRRECNAEAARRTSAALATLTAGTLADHHALADGTEAERHIHPTPYVFVWPSRADFLADGFGWPLRREMGFQWEELDGTALRALVPVLSPEVGFGISTPQSGRIDDPGAYCEALARVMQARGGRLLTAEVTDFIRAPDGRVQGLRAGGEALAADVTVIASGVWSRSLMARLGLEVPIIAERGYHLELLEPSHGFDASLMVTPGKFVLTQMEGRIRLAGLVEIAAPDAPMQQAPLRLLEELVREYFPGLRWRGTRGWVGPRPAPVDSVPLIGAVPGAPGAFCGFGHHHIGLTTGPRTGEMLAGLICGDKANTDLAPFDPARFAHR